MCQRQCEKDRSPGWARVCAGPPEAAGCPGPLPACQAPLPTPAHWGQRWENFPEASRGGGLGPREIGALIGSGNGRGGCLERGDLSRCRGSRAEGDPTVVGLGGLGRTDHSPLSGPQGRPGRAGPEALLLPPHAAGPRGPHREAAQLCAPGEVRGPRCLAGAPRAEAWQAGSRAAHGCVHVSPALEGTSNKGPGSRVGSQRPSGFVGPAAASGRALAAWEEGEPSHGRHAAWVSPSGRGCSHSPTEIAARARALAPHPGLWVLVRLSAELPAASPRI